MNKMSVFPNSPWKKPRTNDYSVKGKMIPAGPSSSSTKEWKGTVSQHCVLGPHVINLVKPLRNMRSIKGKVF